MTKINKNEKKKSKSTRKEKIKYSFRCETDSTYRIYNFMLIVAHHHHGVNPLI
jgi:hypothetical protein